MIHRTDFSIDLILHCQFRRRMTKYEAWTLLGRAVPLLGTPSSICLSNPSIYATLNLEMKSLPEGKRKEWILKTAMFGEYKNMIGFQGKEHMHPMLQMYVEALLQMQLKDLNGRDTRSGLQLALLNRPAFSILREEEVEE